MQALNDLAMIRLEKKAFSAGEKDTAESGILVSLPDEMHYYGFWSFAFENSWGDYERLKALKDYWNKKVGRKVYWTALSERGNIIEKDGERYAFVKLTSLIADDDPESTARNVHADGGGSFGVEK